MPALGARPSAIREASPRPSRPLPPSRPIGGGSLFGGRLPTQPFAPAQRAAQQRVVRAQPRPTPPHLPRLPNPSPAQVRAAHEIAVHYQRAQLGPKPTPQSLSNFQASLRATPEGRAYQQTVGHYLRAGEAHLRGVSGGVSAPGHPEDRLPAGIKQPAWWKDPLGRLVHSALESSRIAGATGREQAIKRGEADVPKSKLELGIPGLASVNIAPLVAALAPHVLPEGRGVLGFLGHAFNEATDLPAQTFLAGQMTGQGTREALQGKPKRLEQIGQSVERQFTHPIASLKEAPVATALTLLGAENAVGRLAGRVSDVGRAIGDGTSVQAAHLARRALPDRPLIGREVETLRQASSDPLRAALGRTAERAERKLPPARQEQIAGRRLARNLAGGTFKVGRLDRVASGGEHNRRLMVRGTVEQMQHVHPGSAAEHATRLIAERLIKTPASALQDATKLRDRWLAAREVVDGEGRKVLKGERLRANKQNVANLEGIIGHLRNGGELGAAFRASGHTAEPIQRGYTRELWRGGKLKPEQLRAALYPYAQLHHGAYYETNPGFHPLALQEKAARQAIGAVRKDAGARIKSAQADLNAAREGRAGARRGLSAREIPRTVRPITGWHTGLAESRNAVRAAEENLKAVRRDARARIKEARATHAELREHLSQVTGIKRNGELHPGMALPGSRVKGEARGAPLMGKAFEDEVLRKLEQEGLSPPIYVSHKTGVAGSGSYFRSVLRQPPLERFRRSGRAFDLGTLDASWEGLLGSMAHSASEAAQLAANRERLGRFTFGGHDGPFVNQAEAHAYLDNLMHTAEGDPQLQKEIGALGTPVVAHLGSKQIVEAGKIEPHPAEDVLKRFGLEEHTPGASGPKGNYAVTFSKVLDRFQQHDDALRARGDVQRFLQRYFQWWRRAKLNFSMRHGYGVTQEQLIRLGAEGAHPGYGLAGAKFQRNLNELGGIAGKPLHPYLADAHGPLAERYRHLNGVLANRGGLVGSQLANDVMRKAEAFEATSMWGRTARAGAKVLASKPGRVTTAPVRGWSRFMEGSLAHLEHGTRSSLLGKALRDTGFIDNWHSIVRMQDAAVKQLIAGKLDHNTADALAKRIDDMGGNWNRQTPAVRRVVNRYTPFGLWWLNSVRWLYRLPLTHPIKTGVGAALYQATREARDKEGQGFDAKSPVPRFLQGTIPVDLPIVGKVRANPTYYSPGGVFANAGEVATEQLAPYLSSAFYNLQGRNPLTKQELTTADKKPLSTAQLVGGALAQLATGPVPLASQAEQALQRGGKPYGTANLFTELAHEAGLAGPQVKSGTQRSALQTLAKTLYPVRFDYPSRGAKAGTEPKLSEGARILRRQREGARTLSPEAQRGMEILRSLRK